MDLSGAEGPAGRGAGRGLRRSRAAVPRSAGAALPPLATVPPDGFEENEVNDSLLFVEGNEKPYAPLEAAARHVAFGFPRSLPGDAVVPGRLRLRDEGRGPRGSPRARVLPRDGPALGGGGGAGPWTRPPGRDRRGGARAARRAAGLG